MDKKLKSVRKLLTSAVHKLNDKVSLMNEELAYATDFLNQKPKRAEYEIRLSAYLQESIVPPSSVRLADVVGLEYAKRVLEDSVILPFEHPNFIDRRVTRNKSILLYGEEGTGKTYLAAALASEMKNGIVIRLSLPNIEQELLAKPDKLFAGMFEFAVQHRPSVLFVDDLESLFNTQSQLCKKLKVAFFDQLRCFLKSFQREEGVVVVGAYSKCQVYIGYEEYFKYFKLRVGLPIQNDEVAKCEIVKVCMRDIANDLSEEDFMELAKKMKAKSAGHVSRVMKDSLRYPLRAVRDATHFKMVRGPLPSDPATIVDDLYTPCSPQDPDAIQINWTEIKEKKLLLSKVTKEQIMQYWKAPPMQVIIEIVK